MKQVAYGQKILSLGLLVGLVCTLVLCGIRITIEQQDNTVSVVISAEDVAALAQQEGMDYDTYQKILLEGGVTAVVEEGVVCESLQLFLGDSYQGQDAVVGLVEDENQYSYEPIQGFTYTEDAQVVRVFSFAPNYSDRYGVLTYEGSQELENIAYRGITERNIRVIWLTQFVHGETGTVISDPYEYTTLVENLADRLSDHGITLGVFSQIEGYQPSILLCLGVVAGVTMAGVLLLTSLFPLKAKWLPWIGGLCYVGAVGLYFVAPSLVALVATLIYPSLSVWFLARGLQSIGQESLPQKSVGLAGQYLKLLLGAFAIALYGGLVVGALLSGRDYLLAVSNFSGVKVSFFLPLLYGGYICYRALYAHVGLGGMIGEYCTSRLLLVVGLLAVVGVVAVLLLRTGDGILSVSIIEQQMRNGLEQLFLARPRTKEFLIAWPACALGVTAVALGWRKIAFPLGVLTTVGLSSVVNTFCHARAHLWISFVRSVLGLCLGAVLGLVIMAILYRCLKRIR